MRSLALVAWLGMIGCGVGPTTESTASLLPRGSASSGGSGGPICSSIAPFSLSVASSSVDPWGSHVGVVVAYASTADSYTLFGVDYPFTQVYWYMTDATQDDINTFESYPQSRRDCRGGEGNPGGGGSPNGTPDPNIYGGVCVPPTIAADAQDAYYWGPNLDPAGNSFYCRYYHGGGCVPRTSCGGACGTLSDGCGGTLWCGACHTCACGGTYPHCYICTPF